MKISHIALACALAVGGSAAFAQNETVNQPNQNGSVSAKELGQKAKRGAKRVGDATKNTFNKVRGKAREGQARDAAAGGVSNSGMQSDQAQGSSSRQQRIDDAYANYQTQQKK
jgi:hypothetical protein